MVSGETAGRPTNSRRKIDYRRLTEVEKSGSTGVRSIRPIEGRSGRGIINGETGIRIIGRNKPHTRDDIIAWLPGGPVVNDNYGAARNLRKKETNMDKRVTDERATTPERFKSCN